MNDSDKSWVDNLSDSLKDRDEERKERIKRIREILEGLAGSKPIFPPDDKNGK